MPDLTTVSQFHGPRGQKINAHDLANEGGELELWVSHAVHLDILDKDSEQDHRNVFPLPNMVLVGTGVRELAEILIYFRLDRALLRIG